MIPETNNRCVIILFGVLFTDKAKNVVGDRSGVSLAVYHPTLNFIHISEITDNGSGNQFTTIFKKIQRKLWLGG